MISFLCLLFLTPLQMQQAHDVFMSAFLPQNQSSAQKLTEYFNNKVRPRLEKGHQIYAAFDGDKMIGCAIYEKWGRDYYLAEMGVASEYQRQGIGKKLVFSILEYNPDKIVLVTGKENLSAQKFYERIGFKSSSFKHPDYPGYVGYEYNQGFDWNAVIQMPPFPVDNPIPSGQVLHFYPFGKSVWNNATTAQYIQKNMQEAKVFQSDADHMRFAVDAAVLDGLVLEFGVCSGKSINFIAALRPAAKVHGFDSFEGLPEDWQERGIAKGTFRSKDGSFRPPVLNNVRLHVGLFEDTLPTFIKNQDDSIAFLHLDADLYESTKTVFKYLGSRIKPGTIIVFDEYFNYNGWENHEYKAFQEFIAESGLNYEYISYNSLHEQVAVRIKDRS